MPTALSQSDSALSLAAHPRLEQDVDVSGVRRTASASVLCHEDNDVATGAGEVKAMRPDLEEREPDSFMPINHARWAGERWAFQTIFSATHDLEERRKGWLLFMPVSKSPSINSWRSNPPLPSLFCGRALLVPIPSFTLSCDFCLLPTPFRPQCFNSLNHLPP